MGSGRPGPTGAPVRRVGMTTRTKIFWAFIAIYVIWGSTYLGIQIAVRDIPPFLLAGSRLIVAGAVLTAWARMQGEVLPAPPTWGIAAVLGTLFFVMGNGLVVWAQQRVPSGQTALLASTSPVWTVVIESLIDRGKRPALRVVLGVGMGLAGLALLAATTPPGRPEPVSLIGIAALVLASLAWAAGSVIAHRRHLPASPAMATGMKMLGGGAQLAVLSVGLGEWGGGRVDPARVSLGAWLALGYLIVFGSIIGFTAFTYLLRVTSPQMVATSSYVNPLVAVFLGWSLAGEIVTPRMLVGAAVILCGVLLIRFPFGAPGGVEPEDVGTIETGEFPVPARDEGMGRRDDEEPRRGRLIENREPRVE